jgi:hypothetical protein
MDWVFKATQRPFLPCEGTMVLTAWEAGFTQTQSGRVGRREISSPPKFESRIIQRAESRCTDYAQNRVFFNTRCEEC